MRKRPWMMKMAFAGTVVSAYACEEPGREGVPPAPRVEESEPGGGAPKPGPETGPDTPAL